MSRKTKQKMKLSEQVRALTEAKIADIKHLTPTKISWAAPLFTFYPYMSRGNNYHFQTSIKIK